MKKDAKVLIVVFSLLLITPLVLTLLSVIKEPDKSFSEWENRELAKFPPITAKAVFSGEWGQDFESFLTDRFCFRDGFTKLKRALDSALLIKENGGVYITENSLFDIPDTPNAEYIENNISAINTFCKNNELDATLILVPSKASLYEENLPPLAPRTEEKELISKIYEQVEIDSVDMYEVFSGRDMSDVFYDTDHHWTSFGAELAYRAWQKSNTDYERVVVSESFLGTLTSRSQDASVSPDVMEKATAGEVFECEIFNGRENIKYPSMYFDEYLSKKDKYSYFLGTNQPLVTLWNKEATSKKTLLIFKDSFAHSFVQYVTDFETVILVDLRYSPSALLSRLAEIAPDEVLFLQSFDTFSTQNNLILLNNLKLFGTFS
jgi:hypothetical protein